MLGTRLGSQQHASRRNIYESSSPGPKTRHRNPRHIVTRKSGFGATFRRVAQRSLRAVELHFVLERSDAGKIADDVLGERFRIAAGREWFLPLPLSPRHQGTRALLDEMIRAFEHWNPEYLHMPRTRYRAEIGDDVILHVGRNQGRQENNVRDALVDRGESVVDRVNDNDVL